MNLLDKHSLVLYFSYSLFIFLSRGKEEQLHPSPVRVALFGSTTRIECIIGETNSEFTLTWISHGNINVMQHATNEEPLKIEGKFKSLFNNNKSIASLDISNIIFEDAGKYDCSVTFHSAGTSQSMSWILIVQGRPKINICSLIVENKPTEAECCINVTFAMNRSDMEIVWKIGREILHSEIWPGEQRTTSVTMETVCSNVKLIFIRLHHDRMLQCFVRNELHESGRVKLNVNYLTNANVIVGSSYNPSDAVKVRKDESVNITCSFQGNPSPNISLQRRNMGKNWINISVETYPVKQNIPMTSQTFLYKSTEEKSVRFRCTAYNSIGFTTQSKEFQIEILDSDDSQGSNITQTVIVVCVGLAIVGALILRHRLKDTSSSHLKLSKLRNRGRYSMRHTDTSQRVPDVCRHSPDVKVTDNSVFYNVLESEEYEVVETEKDRRQSDDFISVDTGTAMVTYAKVKKMSWTEKCLKETKRTGNVSSDIEETLPTYAEVLKSK